MTKPELTLSDAARLLGLSWAQTYNRILNGRLVGRRVLGRWLVTRDSVNEYARLQHRSRPPHLPARREGEDT